MKKLGLLTKLTSFRNKVVRASKTPRKPKKNFNSQKSSNSQGVKLPDFIRKYSIIIKVLSLLIIILFFFVIIDGLFFYTNLKFKIYPNTPPTEYFWNGSERINLLLIGIDEKSTGHTFVDRVVVVHINPDAPSAGIFSINTKFQTTLPNNSKSSLRLAFIEGEENGEPIEYLERGVENLVGVKIHKYVVISSNKIKDIFGALPNPPIEIEDDIIDEDFGYIAKGNYSLNPDELYNYLATDALGEDDKMTRLTGYVETLSRELFQPQFLLSSRNIATKISDGIYTNLSKEEMIRLSLFVSGLREDQVSVAHTKESSGLPVEGDIFRLQPVIEDIDKDLQTILVNPKVRFEQARIEVLNATQSSGVASRKARLIENLGGRVIRVGNTPDEYTKNYIFVKNPENYEVTLKEIESAFEGNVTVLREEYPNRHVADIVIVIGEDV